MIKVVFEKKEKNTKEFSKKIMCIVAVSAIVGSIGTILATLFLGLPEALACAIIAALGSVALTSIVFYYKKAQAENTIKLYLSSYLQILRMKKKFGENTSDMLDTMETGMLGKLDTVVNQTLDEATTSIEKEDIAG
jgi:hypothetical protein